jgi:hypothetical protein
VIEAHTHTDVGSTVDELQAIGEDAAIRSFS